MDFVFLSYNIQLAGLDVRGHEWDVRKEAVVDLLRQADLIALQEVSVRQGKEICLALPDYTFLGYNTVTGENLSVVAPEDQEGLMIGWRTRRGTINQDYQLHWYSDTPLVPSTGECAFPKCLQRVQLLWDGQPLEILNSHFPHDENMRNGFNPRQRAADQEIQIIQSLTCPWVSAGDRNFHTNRDEAIYQTYFSSGISDARTKENASGCLTTFLGYEGHPRCNPYTVTGEFEHIYYLDVVFHSPTLHSHRWISHLGEYDQDGTLLTLGPVRDLTQRSFASDHTAIFVHFSHKSNINPE